MATPTPNTTLPVPADIAIARSATTGDNWRELNVSRRTGRHRPHRIANTVSRIAVPVVLIVAWQILSSAGVISPTKLDSPATVLQALWDLTKSGTLQASLKVSLQRAALGFILGASFGLSAGLFSGLSRIGERAVDASLQMLRTIPFLAVIPLFVIWFGVGETAKITLIALACVFPVYLNTYAGVRNVDPKIVEAADTFGLGRVETAIKIVLPLAAPTILVGIRYSLGVALLALVAAEQVNATSGIGYLALSPRAAMRTDIVLGIVAIYAVLGLAVDLIVRLISRIVVPWHQTVLGKES